MVRWNYCTLYMATTNSIIISTVGFKVEIYLERLLNPITSHKNLVTDNLRTTGRHFGWVFNICDWAYENRAYLHKLHMFRKWYFYWSVLKIFQFCKRFLLSYGFVNKAWRFHCHSSCTSENIVSWSWKIRPNFVCRYALFLQARLQISFMFVWR